MKCPNCGRENSQNANFCRACSTKLKEICDCIVASIIAPVIGSL